jgi:hypothetical protein
MFKSQMQRTVIFLAVSFIFFSVYTRSVLACGGVTATIADDPKAFAVTTEKGPGDATLHFDKVGNVYLAAEDVKISSALAEAIAIRYLEKRYKSYGHLEFEAFTYDHGDLVYMYHADVPNLAYSVHIGPVKSVADHAHVHVSAITGDVYGPGCGLGSGVVEMQFDPKEYPKDLNKKRLPYLQFDAHFVVGEGSAPKIDGRIEKAEWQDSAHQVVYIGTLKDKVTEYG